MSSESTGSLTSSSSSRLLSITSKLNLIEHLHNFTQADLVSEATGQVFSSLASSDDGHRATSAPLFRTIGISPTSTSSSPSPTASPQWLSLPDPSTLPQFSTLQYTLLQTFDQFQERYSEAKKTKSATKQQVIELYALTCLMINQVEAFMNRWKAVLDIIKVNEANQFTNETSTLMKKNAIQFDLLAHEFKTPLSALSGSFEIMMRTLDEKKIKELFNEADEIIDSSLKHATKLFESTEKQLDLETMTIEREPFEMDVLIKNTENIFKNYDPSREKKLIFKSDAKLSKTLLLGDQMKLRQVLLNLISNGIKYSPGIPEVTVNIELIDQTQDSSHVRFSVEDHGLGIPKEKMKELGVAASTINSPLQSKSQTASGFGLYLVYKFVEKMRGRVQVSTTYGGSHSGSTFSFELIFPKYNAASASAKVAMPSDFKENSLAALSAVAASLKLSEAAKGSKILVVDDSPLIQKMRSKQIETLGHSGQLSIATDGEEALKLYKKAASDGKPFDVVITDEQMPKMSGIELARTILTLNSGGKKTPLIILAPGNRIDLPQSLANCPFFIKGDPINFLAKFINEHFQ